MNDVITPRNGFQCGATDDFIASVGLAAEHPETADRHGGRGLEKHSSDSCSMTEEIRSACILRSIAVSPAREA